jgi:hypothetical protein
MINKNTSECNSIQMGGLCNLIARTARYFAVCRDEFVGANICCSPFRRLINTQLENRKRAIIEAKNASELIINSSHNVNKDELVADSPKAMKDNIISFFYRPKSLPIIARLTAIYKNPSVIFSKCDPMKFANKIIMC